MAQPFADHPVPFALEKVRALIGKVLRPGNLSTGCLAGIPVRANRDAGTSTNLVDGLPAGHTRLVCGARHTEIACTPRGPLGRVQVRKARPASNPHSGCPRFSPTGIYADLLPDEQRKLERMDNAVSALLIGAGITDRAIWTTATERGHRVVRICAGKRTILDIDSGELATIPDNTLLSRLQTAVNRVG